MKFLKTLKYSNILTNNLKSNHMICTSSSWHENSLHISNSLIVSTRALSSKLLPYTFPGILNKLTTVSFETDTITPFVQTSSTQCRQIYLHQSTKTTAFHYALNFLLSHHLYFRVCTEKWIFWCHVIWSLYNFLVIVLYNFLVIQWSYNRYEIFRYLKWDTLKFF